MRVDPAPPVVLVGDEYRLTQALLNLVVNARTHTPPGTPITVDAVTEDQHIAFRVADRGPGIDPDLLPSVFDPFVTTKADGAERTSGLGLTVVKAVTEAQGGTVESGQQPVGDDGLAHLPDRDRGGLRLSALAARLEGIADAGELLGGGPEPSRHPGVARRGRPADEGRVATHLPPPTGPDIAAARNVHALPRTRWARRPSPRSGRRPCSPCNTSQSPIRLPVRPCRLVAAYPGCAATARIGLPDSVSRRSSSRVNSRLASLDCP